MDEDPVAHDGPRGSLKRTVAFVAIAYAWSWAWWVGLAAAGVVVEPGDGWPSHLPGLLGPAISAALVTAATRGRTGLAELWSRIVRWRVDRIWYLVVVAMGVVALVPLVTNRVPAGELVSYSGAPGAGLLVVGYVLLVNGFGEEIGWRGFLAEELLGRISVGRTAFVVWPVWALWHLPLFWVVGNFRDFGVVGTIGWVVGIGFGSVVLTWMYDSASRSILVVALFHTAYNFTTATDAAAGLPAVLTSAVVIAGGVVILRRPSSWAFPPPGGGRGRP